MNPLDTEPTYYAIKDLDYEKLALADGEITRKPVRTTIPYEAGSRYQYLCEYACNHPVHGGFKLTPTGELTYYTKAQLIEDYEPDAGYGWVTL